MTGTVRVILIVLGLLGIGLALLAGRLGATASRIVIFALSGLLIVAGFFGKLLIPEPRDIYGVAPMREARPEVSEPVMPSPVAPEPRTVYGVAPLRGGGSSSSGDPEK